MGQRINWKNLEKYIVQIDKSVVNMRQSKFAVSCFDCQNERIVTYTAAHFIACGKTNNLCNKCLIKNKIRDNTEYLKLGRKYNPKKQKTQNKGTFYRNLFNNPNLDPNVKEKMRQAKLGKKGLETNRFLNRSEDEWKLVKKQQRKKYKEKVKNDPIYKMIRSLRERTRNMLINKCGFNKRIGCDSETLKKHIESQFKTGMTWDNYATVWAVDHIFPIAQAKKISQEALLKSFNYKNLQPLFVEENQIKRDKILVEENFLDSI